MMFTLTKEQMYQLIDALDLGVVVAEEYSDVEDGDYGVPYPNRAMRAVDQIGDALDLVWNVVQESEKTNA